MPKVVIYPAGGEDDGVAQYRLLLPARALIEQGADIEITYVGPTLLWDREWEAGKPGVRPPPEARIMGMTKPPDADVVVMQRPTERWWADCIPYLKQRGIKVVVDVDDLFDRIDDGHVGKTSFTPSEEGRRAAHNYQWVHRACQIADLVTCTTPALSQRYGYGHSCILPNMVPASYLTTRSLLGQLESVGWTGSVGTHPKDLQVTGNAVQDVLDASGWGFHVVGTGNGVQPTLGLSEAPTASDWVPFVDYPREMSRIGVGIVPLADTPFNRAKSCLKSMEFAAVGVPAVVSPTPDNLRLNKRGVNVTASTPQQWKKRLRSLVMNAEYRAEVAGTGHEVVSNLTYEKNCNRWWAAWTSTLHGRTDWRERAARKLVKEMA